MIFSYREKLMPYNFKVVYLAGKANCAADCLSRMVVWTENAADEDPAELPGGANRTRKVFCQFSNKYARQDRALDWLFATAAKDDDYQLVIQTLRSRKEPKDMTRDNPAK